jgi:hypothetical protein
LPDDTTTIAARDDTTDLVSPVDVLFSSASGRHLVVPVAKRVDAFFQIVHQLAEAEIAVEMSHEGHTPKPNEIAGRIAQRELQHVEEWHEMLDAAYMRKAYELADISWLNGDGQWQDVADVLIEAMPEDTAQRSSGRARQVAQFIQEGVPAMKAVGVSPTLIEEAYQGRPSILSEVSAAVRIVERQGLEDDETKQEYEWILGQAATSSIRDFKAAVSEKYHPDKPTEYTVYTKQQVGDWIRVVMEMSPTMWNIALNRLHGNIREAPSDLSICPPPDEMQVALGLRQMYEDTGEMVVWDTNGQSVMRKVITANPWRSICLNALEKNAGRWVSITDITSITRISPLRVKSAMQELCNYVRDGWNTWAVRHPKEELWQLNQ